MTWFVIRSATRREKTAAQSLRELGFTVYLPCETRWVRHARTKTSQTYPLFAGYLFARLPGFDTWSEYDLDAAKGGEAVHKVMFFERSVDGVATYVSAIRSKYVDKLAEAEAEGKFDKTLKDRPKPKGESPFKKGDPARIMEGPFSGFIANVTKVRGSDRVNLLVSLFGKVQDVEIAVKDLEAA